MKEPGTAEEDGFVRCGFPTPNLQLWLAQNGKERLRIATYGLSKFRYFGHFLSNGALPELLVGVSGIDPMLFSDLHDKPARERWHRLLTRLDYESLQNLLKLLGKASEWQRAGATVRIALPGRLRGLMHLKVYLAHYAALVGSANFTAQGLTGEDQHELLLEVQGTALAQLCRWWQANWAQAWPSKSRSK